MPEENNVFTQLENSMGACLQAMSTSPLYSQKPLAELMQNLLPALTTRNFRVVTNSEGQSVAYVSWAMVNDAVLEKLSGGGDAAKLKPSDWQSGDIGLLMDVVAKNAQASNLLVAKVKDELFKDKPLKAMRLQSGQMTLADV